MLYLVHQYILDKKLVQNLFGIKLILVEGETSIQNQHLIMDQFIYQDPISSEYRRHYSCLPQTVSKILMNHLTQNVRYYFMVIGSVISGYSPNE